MNYQKFLLVGLASLSAASLGCATPASLPEKPNIVILFADDLGYADLGCQGSDEVLSPRIDSIAAQGIRFTDGYVTAAQCSPSRAGLISGRYHARFGYDVNMPLKYVMDGIGGLPLEMPTIGDIMQSAGYTTGVIGKWDLGTGADYYPNKRGFDYFYGFVGGSRHHPPGRDPYFFNDMQRNGEVVEETDWSSDIYGQEAADFIRRNRDEPFFLYVSYTAPHWPMQAKEADMAKFAHVEDLHRRTFLAMMSGLDRGVGKVLDALQETGLQEKTLVIFLSDNGGATGPERTDPTAEFKRGVNTSRNDPLRGHKGQLYEGGVRIPFMAAWPGVIKPGQVVDTPVISLDIAATAAALGGASISPDYPLDGVDLMPLLTAAPAGLPERDLYWRVKNHIAIRRGDWKFIKVGQNPAELFHLSEDISESNNLFKDNPERAAELREELKAWLQTLEAPRW